MWIPFARLLKSKRNPSSWQMMQLYELNHIGKTFGVSLDEFVRDPWQYLGKPSPEIQRLWDRPHRLLPRQMEIVLGDSCGIERPSSRPIRRCA